MILLTTLVRRVLPTLVVVTMLVYLAARLLPGDVVSLLWEQGNYTPEDVASERERLGLDEPVYVQYFSWLASTVRGDLGNSLWTGRPVGQDIVSRLEVTLELALLAMVFTLVVGVLFGVAAALMSGRVPDHLLRSVSVVGLSLPEFVTATIILFASARYFNWIPPLRYVPLRDDPIENLTHFFLPAVLLASHYGAILMRMTRIAVLDVLREDYVRTARAKGLTERVILLQHVLRNASPLILSTAGLMLVQLLGGAVVMETIFGLPGLGLYTLDAVTRRDYVAVQGVVLVVAVFVLLANVAVDLFVYKLTPQSR